MKHVVKVNRLQLAIRAAMATLALGSVSIPAMAQEDDNERQSQPDQPIRKVVLAELLSGKDPITFHTATAMYSQTVLSDGDVSKLLEKLEAQGDDTAHATAGRINALLLASYLQWQDGRMKGALQLVDKALKIEMNPDVLTQKARLLEASGDIIQARQCYEQVLPLLHDPEKKENVRLRLTFIEVGKKNVQALVKLAHERDADFRNRTAVALAILNYYDEANGLYEIKGEGGDLFRQRLRVAQWALRANDARKAQEEAWIAVQTAPLPRDRQYSLSVALDAYEMDNSLDKLVKRFEKKGKLTEEERNVHIEVLRKLKRYDEAIKLFLVSSTVELDADTQQQLLRMYRDAGRSADMIAEYKKLIAKEPANPAWPSGLSQYYLEQNDRAAAQQVWRDFIARNGETVVLLDGAGDMMSFGFDDLALEASNKVLGGYQPDHFTALMFNFELYQRRGRTEDAEKTLEKAQKILPPDSMQHVEVADGYERLKRSQQALKVFEELAKNRPGGVGIDERMRMAWLYDSLGQRDKAMGVWQSLWNESVSDARRKLIEDRLLMLAAETGELGAIAVDLEDKLISGTGSAKDSALLIRIYTEARDTAAAIEIIQKYFKKDGKGAESVAGLQEQAKVYQALNRFGAYGQINEKLLEVDPENKIDYLQALVLNRLENEKGASEEKNAQLDKWLAMLRSIDSAAAGDEFEAGILELAGLDDRAIAVYRRALASDPTHSDNYLLLAELLKRSMRESEAIAMLQYQVETAERDDAFMVAVDGILNMDPQDGNVVKWAQRRVLERLTVRDDKLYLYDLLSELAENEKDTETYLSALENSLAYANSRRSTVLRQLISATGEGVSSLGASISGRFTKPNLERNLTYSRRLVALGEELPPEIYLDMGKNFLKMKDLQNASDSFNIAIDRTGRSVLMEDTGDYFRVAGYNKQAINQYERALIADAGKVSLMCSLADVRDRIGQREEANQLYLSALLGLIGKQPTRVEETVGGETKPEDSFTFDYKNYYWRLIAGFVRTVPADLMNANGKSSAQFEKIEKLFNETLQQTKQEQAANTGEKAGQLTQYPRMSSAADFARASALRLGNYQFADKIDTSLLAVFGQDNGLLKDLVEQRMGYGLRSSAEFLVKGSSVSTSTKQELLTSIGGKPDIQRIIPSADMVAKVRESGDYSRAADIATFIGEQDLALAAYRDWIKSTVDKKKQLQASANAAAMMMRGGSDNFGWILSHAQNRLDAQRYASLCGYIFDMAKEQQEYATMLLYSGNKGGGFGYGETKVRKTADSRLFEMEKITGRVLFTEAQLMDSLDAINADKSGQADMVYVMSKLSQSNQVAFLTGYLKARDFNGVNWSEVFSALQVVLTKPVNAKLSAQLGDSIKEKIAAEMGKGEHTVVDWGKGAEAVVRSASTWGGARFTENIDKSNVAWLESLDDELSKNYPTAFVPGVFKINARFDAGNVKQAVPLIVDNAVAKYVPQLPKNSYELLDKSGTAFAGNAAVAQGYNKVMAYLRLYKDRLYPQYVPDMTAQLAAKEKELGLTPAIFATQMALQEVDPTNDDVKLARWLEEKNRLAPKNEMILSALYTAYAKLGFADKEMVALQGLVDVAPQNISYRARLFARWQEFEHPENALTIASGRLADVMSAASKLNPQGQAQTPYGQPASATRLVQQVVAVDNGGSAEDAKYGLRTLLQMLPPQPAQNAKMSGGYFARDPNDEKLEFGILTNFDWSAKDPDAKPEELDGMPGLVRLLESDDAAASKDERSGKFLDNAIKQSFAVAELEALLSAQEPRDIDGQYLLYKLLGDAYEKHGQAAAVFERHRKALEAGSIGNKELTVWLDLASRQPQSSAQAALTLIEQRGAGLDSASLYQQALLARLYAKAGQGARAIDIYSAVLVLGQGRSGGFSLGFNDRSAFFTSLVGLYGDAKKYLSAENLDQFAKRILVAAVPKDTSDRSSRSPYFTFVIEMTKQNPDSKTFAAAFQDIYDRYAKTDLWSHQTRMAAADLLARAGKNQEGLQLLQAALKSFTDDPNATGAQYSQMIFMMGRQTGPRSKLSRFTAFRTVLPSPVNTWPGAKEWMSQIASSVPGWVEQRVVNREGGMWLLSMVALRQQQLGFADDAKASAKLIQGFVSQPEVLPLSAGTLAVSVMNKVGVTVDAKTLEGLIQYKRVIPGELTPLIQQVAKTDGANKALSLGEMAAGYTQEEDLLQELKALCTQAGDTTKVRNLNEMDLRAGEARGRIERGEDIELTGSGTAVASAAGTAPGAQPAGAQPEVGDLLDIKFTALDGREVDLEKLRGKVVLIDFWATWCGPCRQEMPNLKRAYDAYHAKGFEVLGVTLDSANSKQTLIDYVKSSGLAWPQHFDGKGWKNEFAVRYAIDGVPSAFLLDQKGKLVTKTARGKNLEAELKRLLNITD